MDVQCCKCMKTRDQDGWQWTKEITDRSVSYTYCPECLEEFRYEAGYSVRQQPSHASPALVAVCA